MRKIKSQLPQLPFQMRAFFITACLVIISIFPLKAQFGLSAELLIANPFYLQSEEIGVTTNHLQKGIRITPCYYSDFGGPLSLVSGLRFTHHFGSTDSAIVQVYGNNFDHQQLSGSVKCVFNSIIPNVGVNFESQNSRFLSYTILVGMGAAWGRGLYEFPTYDSLTMEYFNPPWAVTGKYNEERKLVAIRPCMMLNFAVLYELPDFFIFGNADLTYSMGEFPPTPVSIGAGIIFPFVRNE